MYRRSRKTAERIRAKVEAMRRGRERAALAREPQGRAPDLPLLRREVVVTDYDSGEPVTRRLAMYRTRRVDSYRVEVDGQPWQAGMGWARILAALRRAYPRVPSPRSDFWW